MSILSSLMSRVTNKNSGTLQRKQAQHQERLQQQDDQRQKDPNGLLKIALKGGVRRQSLTIMDPGWFYKLHPKDHAEYSPRKDKLEATACKRISSNVDMSLYESTIFGSVDSSGLKGRGT